MEQAPLKMYILIMDWMDVGHAVNSAAHAALIAHKAWNDDPEYQEWYEGSFRKVSCVINEAQLKRAMACGYEYRMVGEMAFDHPTVALVFKPRREWNGFFRSLPLYGHEGQMFKYYVKE